MIKKIGTLKWIKVIFHDDNKVKNIIKNVK